MKRQLYLTLVAVSMPLLAALAQGGQKGEQDNAQNKILSYFPSSTGKPRIPDQYRVTSVDQLMPGTRYYLKHGTKARSGEQILIVDDSKNADPMITEAWARAARELGAIVDIVTLDPVSHRPSPEIGRLGSEPTSWWPTWLDDAILRADATLVLAPININHGIRRETIGEKWNSGRVGLPGNIYTREQLAFTKWTCYPAELDIALQRKLYEVTDAAGGPKVIRITNQLGTDLTFSEDVDKDWIRKHFAYDLTRIEVMFTHRTEYMFVHNKISPGLSTKPDANGVLVTTSLPTGPTAPLKLYLENGRITRVEGDSPAATQWRSGLEKNRNVDYGFPHGKGVGWMEGVYFGTNPKVIRPDFFNPDYFKEQGSYNYWWCEIKRSGFVHIGFGKGWSGLDGLKGTPQNWHSDVFLPFPTVYVNGEKVIYNGHLVILDDPEIRRIAAKYGNPDELLREEFVPPYDSDPSLRGYYTKEQYAEILRAFGRQG